MVLSLERRLMMINEARPSGSAHSEARRERARLRTIFEEFTAVTCTSTGPAHHYRARQYMVRLMSMNHNPRFIDHHVAPDRRGGYVGV